VPDFTPKQCLKALAKLGFRIIEDKGRGGHFKAKVPLGFKIAAGKRDFIMIPDHKKFKNRFYIVDELKAFGFDIEKFINLL